MTEKNECACSAGPKLIFSCSGAADVGEIADRAARQLTRDGVGKMYCTAGVGGRVHSILENTAAASRLLALDGCPLDCVKHLLEQAGFTEFVHVRVTDLGMTKGKTPASDENIARVVTHVRAALEM